jgi:hypothetical protein
MSKSCLGCKFLYDQDEGYSNYTVIDTSTICALDLNDKLPAESPRDRQSNPDNWPATMCGRCDRYAEGVAVHLDVEGDDYVEDQTEDEEQRAAILKSSGRDPKPQSSEGCGK